MMGIPDLGRSPGNDDDGPRHGVLQSAYGRDCTLLGSPRLARACSDSGCGVACCWTGRGVRDQLLFER